MARRWLFSLLLLTKLSSLNALDVEQTLEEVISISTVPTYAKTEKDVVFPVDKGELRLFMASSYIDTAHRALKLTDRTKTIACFAAAYGWLSEFLTESGPISESLMQNSIMKIVESLIMLTYVAKPFDSQAACCAGVEAMLWSKRYPQLSQYVQDALQSTQLWDSCPSNYPTMASSVQLKSPQDNGVSSMQCTRLGLLINAEDIIGSFYLNQEELFRKKSHRHDYHPYETTNNISRTKLSEKERSVGLSSKCLPSEDDSCEMNLMSAENDKHCTCEPPSILYDMEVEPLIRFTPDQWSYIDESLAKSSFVSASSKEPHQKRSMDEWKKVPEAVESYGHLLRSGLELEFAEMFHSCVPDAPGVILNEALTTELVCVWRRHMQLFHMGAAIFKGSLSWLTPPPVKIDATSIIGDGHQPKHPIEPTIRKSSAHLVKPGEDPRLFKFRGKYYFSMQKVTQRQGKQWSKTTFDQEFSNFLVELESGTEVELRIPQEYTKESIDADHNGVSFAPHGKNWTPFIYEDELLFIFSFKPLRILHCNVEDGQCEWWHQPPKGTSTAIGVLRGGSAGMVLNNYVIGFGHATLSSAQHTAFFFAINLKCLGPNRDVSCLDNETSEKGAKPEDPLSLSFMPAKSFATPFSGFGYMDPTSFWMTSSNNTLLENSQDFSSTHPFTKNENNSIRLFVMCTLRAAPDYLSFDQSHHQTVIFEAKTELLHMILAQENFISMETIQSTDKDWRLRFKSDTEVEVAVEDEAAVWV